MYKGTYFMNHRGKALTVTSDVNMNHLQMQPKTKAQYNGVHQKWTLKYVDELPPPPKKGDWVPEYGLHHLRDFHFISSLPSGRYLDLIGSQTVIKTEATNRKTQIWFFDYYTRSIRSRNNAGVGLHLQSNGNGRLVQVAGNSQQWW